jgi:hypothetical protein
MSSPVAVPRGLPRLDCRRRPRCAALGEGVRARNTVIAHISRGPSLPEPLPELRFRDAKQCTAATESNRRQAALLDPAIDARSGDVQPLGSLGNA